MPGAGVLLRYELRRVVRAPIVWVLLALLFAAATWGTVNTARLHRDQAADLTRMAHQESVWYADVEARAIRYAQPSPVSVPYWQDPTGASGFSRYFLKRFAAKPHLPLSVLAVGQSDLQPFAVPVRLETLFGGDRVHDFEPPRALATGFFDLGFVLVFVLPLCVGAVAATMGAQERDDGVLALVSAQPVSPVRWWAARLGALAAVLVPGTVLGAVVALVIAGAPIVTAWPETLATMVLVAAHVLLWLAVPAACLVRGQGAVGTASTVTAVWLALTLVMPLSGALAVRLLFPPPSPIADVRELRRTVDAVQREANAVVARRLVATLGPRVHAIDPTALDYSTRLVLITPEMEERLAMQEERRRAHMQSAGTAASLLAWLSPQLAFQTALTDLAGTGIARHARFLEAVRAYQLELRNFMYPRVLRSAQVPGHRACDGCPGRLTFTDYAAIPRFTMPEPSVESNRMAALSTAAWLLVLAAVITGVSLGRASWAIVS